MAFTYSEIPNISNKRFLYKDEGIIKSIAGSEIPDLEEFFTGKEVYWFSIANYVEPHLSQSDIDSITFAVELPPKHSSKYKQIMESDFNITFTQVPTEKEQCVLFTTAEEFSELSEYQRYKIASYPDLRSTNLEDLTNPEYSYNQNHQTQDFSSTYGSGMSNRVFLSIESKINQLLNSDDPVENVKSYLTGPNTQQRAEDIVETLSTEQDKQILFKLGSLKPTKSFEQIINSIYKNMKDNISIPFEYEQLYFDSEYIKVDNST